MKLKKLGGLISSLLNKTALINALLAGGWLKSAKPSLQVLLQAVRAYQRFHKLKVDGVVGPVTARVLAHPRICGMADNMRLGATNYRWLKQHFPITVGTFIQEMDGLTYDDVKQVALEGIAEVESVCGVRMKWIDDPRRANLYTVVQFIDGPSRVLADQQLPVRSGKTQRYKGRFDDGDRYVIAVNPGMGVVDFKAVYNHEVFGHGLGMEHLPANFPDAADESDVALMQPFYRAGLRTFQDRDNQVLQRKYPGAPKKAEPGGPVGPGGTVTIRGSGTFTITNAEIVRT